MKHDMYGDVSVITSVSSSILAPSACSRAKKMSSDVFPDFWSKVEKKKKVWQWLVNSKVKMNACRPKGCETWGVPRLISFNIEDCICYLNTKQWINLTTVSSFYEIINKSFYLSNQAFMWEFIWVCKHRLATRCWDKLCKMRHSWPCDWHIPTNTIALCLPRQRFSESTENTMLPLSL